MMFPINMVVILAGFYLTFRVSLKGAFFAGLFVGCGLALLESLCCSNSGVEILINFASYLSAAVFVYMLTNYFDGILGFLLFAPAGFLLLLAGGPIKLVMLFMD
jgi:hypothetical protein